MERWVTTSRRTPDKLLSDGLNSRIPTIYDEEWDALAGKNRLRLLDAFGLQDGRTVRWLPNARAGTAVFHFVRD